jgi:hypothetical protein
MSVVHHNVALFGVCLTCSDSVSLSMIRMMGHQTVTMHNAMTTIMVCYGRITILCIFHLSSFFIFGQHVVLSICKQCFLSR